NLYYRNSLASWPRRTTFGFSGMASTKSKSRMNSTPLYKALAPRTFAVSLCLPSIQNHETFCGTPIARGEGDSTSPNTECATRAHISGEVFEKSQCKVPAVL